MVLCDFAGGCAPDASWVIVTSMTACSFLNTCTKMEINSPLCQWLERRTVYPASCLNGGKFKVKYYAHWLKIKVKTLF